MPACRDKFSRQQASLISHLHPWQLWLLRALPKINYKIVKLQPPTQGRQEMLSHRGLRTTQQRLRTFDTSGEEAGGLYSRLRDNNFLNREGSGGARALTT